MFTEEVPDFGPRKARRMKGSEGPQDPICRWVANGITENVRHRSFAVFPQRKLRGAGVIIWALICALARNDWAPGLCFSSMAISFGIYGLVNVFSSESSHWWRRSSDVSRRDFTLPILIEFPIKMETEFSRPLTSA
jgi:hypothetical protein